MENYLHILKSEFEAQAGSFLIQMRSDLKWDALAFDRLTSAMKECCKAYRAETKLDRWLAEGFWYVSVEVSSWTSHPNFRLRNPDIDYETAYQLLDALAYWFFIGESPYRHIV